jgi:hypothetical protein
MVEDSRLRIEPVDCGQVLVAVTEVVLAELPCGITVVLQ